LAVTISFGIQKGGVGKTTTAAITSYLLSKKTRVLAVDFDSQGNLTQFLTQQNIYNFSGRTVLEATKEKNAEPYIYKVSDQLHLLPAEDILATFSQYIYMEYPKKYKQNTESHRLSPSHLLKETLDTVKDQYGYIIIDLPPNLGDLTINGLTASDYAVVILQSEPFCYDALDRYLETLQIVQRNTNPSLRLGGILATLLDVRTTIDSAVLDKARQDYEDVLFNSVIRRRSRIKEFTIEGLQEKTKHDREALQPYKDFVEELIQRV